jgi:hypothetical protein
MTSINRRALAVAMGIDASSVTPDTLMRVRAAVQAVEAAQEPC